MKLPFFQSHPSWSASLTYSECFYRNLYEITFLPKPPFSAQLVSLIQNGFIGICMKLTSFQSHPSWSDSLTYSKCFYRDLYEITFLPKPPFVVSFTKGSARDIQLFFVDGLFSLKFPLFLHVGRWILCTFSSNFDLLYFYKESFKTKVC